MKKSILMVDKRSQVFGLDLLIAVIILSVGIFGIYFYEINYPGQSTDIIEGLNYDGSLISSQILSEGSPLNWTKETVEIPGILTNNKINQSKLDEIYNFSQEDYSSLKKILGTNYNFYFNFSGIEITNVGIINGIGNQPINQENLIKVERFSIYKNKPIKFNLYMWD